MIYTCEHCHQSYTDLPAAQECERVCKARKAAANRAMVQEGSKARKALAKRRAAKPARVRVPRPEVEPRIPMELAPKGCMQCGQPYYRPVGSDYRMCPEHRARAMRYDDAYTVMIPTGGRI